MSEASKKLLTLAMLGASVSKEKPMTTERDIAERLTEPSMRSHGGKKLPDGSYHMGCECSWGPGPVCVECTLREDPLRKEAAAEIQSLRTRLAAAEKVVEALEAAKEYLDWNEDPDHNEGFKPLSDKIIAALTAYNATNGGPKC